MERNNVKTNRDKDFLLPSPQFTSKPVDKVRIICQIWFVSSSIRNVNHSNLQKVAHFETFMDYAQRWRQFDHKYYKVHDATDFTNSNDKYAHKACKRKFLKQRN